MTNSMWQELQQAKLIAIDKAEPAINTNQEPLYLKVIAAIGGWLTVLASLFFTSAFVWSLNSSFYIPTLINALIYSGLTFLLIKNNKNHTSSFLMQIALASYVVSQTSLVITLSLIQVPVELTTLSVIGINIIVFLLLPIHAFKLLSCLLAFISLAIYLEISRYFNFYLWVFYSQFILLILSCLAWLNLTARPIIYAWLYPVALSSTLIYLASCILMLNHSIGMLDIFDLLNYSVFNNTKINLPSLIHALTCLGLGIYTVIYLKLPKTFIALIIILSWLNYYIYGLAGAVILLMLVMQLKHRIYILTLLASLIYLAFIFYYSLNFNLMYKSILLFIASLTFFSFFFINKYFYSMESAHA